MLFQCAAEEKKESPSVEGKGPAADLDFGTIESSKEELNKVKYLFPLMMPMFYYVLQLSLHVAIL